MSITLASKRYTIAAYAGALDSRYPDGHPWSTANRLADSFEENSLLTAPPPFDATADWSAPSNDVTIQTTYAKTGTRSKRFRYPVGTSTAEQRFTYATTAELWASWWLRVPDNYTHSSVPALANNKLFSFWMDGYSAAGDGSTFNMEMRSDGGGSSYWYVKLSAGRYSVAGSDLGNSRFITVPDDRGRWMQIVVNCKPETSEDASDGRVRVWRKWDGDSSFTAVYDYQDRLIRVPAAGPYGFERGYLMGWANGTYVEETDFYIDDFEIADFDAFGVT